MEEGIESTVEIRQDDGGDREVMVFDDAGRRVAGASIQVVPDRGATYCAMEGDTQLLGLHTDIDGRLLLRGLPHGRIAITVTFGSRTATVSPETDGPLEVHLPPVR